MFNLEIAWSLTRQRTTVNSHTLPIVDAVVVAGLNWNNVVVTLVVVVAVASVFLVRQTSE